MFDMFGKLNELRASVEESKAQLQNMELTEELENGQLRVVVSGDRELKSLHIAPELMQRVDHEALEDLLIVALRRAMHKAKEVESTTLKEAAGGLLPPGFSL